MGPLSPHFVSATTGVFRECGDVNTSVTHSKPFLTALMACAHSGREAEIVFFYNQNVDFHTFAAALTGGNIKSLMSHFSIFCTCRSIKVISPNLSDFDVSPLAPPPASSSQIRCSRKIFPPLKT